MVFAGVDGLAQSWAGIIGVTDWNGGLGKESLIVSVENSGTSLRGFLAKGLPHISPAQRAGCWAESERFAEGELHKAARMTLSFRELAWLPFCMGRHFVLPHAGIIQSLPL